jgi:hypothetical protein
LNIKTSSLNIKLNCGVYQKRSLFALGGWWKISGAVREPPFYCTASILLACRQNGGGTKKSGDHGEARGRGKRRPYFYEI